MMTYQLMMTRLRRGDVINSSTEEKVTRVDRASPDFVTGLGDQGT